MSKYADYLRSLGTTDADIAILDTPVSQRVYEKMEASLAEERSKGLAYQTKVNEWHDNIDSQYKELENKYILSESERAKATAAIKLAQERGLIASAKDLGFDVDAPAAPTVRTDPNGFDSKQYFTRAEIIELARAEGRSIALVADIAREHALLFPDKPINFSALHEEATSKNTTVQALWQERYNVLAAREARQRADKEAYEAKLIAQGRELAVKEFADKYGNPDTRPLEPSRNFLAPRPAINREKAPWESGFDGEGGSNDRVRRATQNAMKTTLN